MDSFYRPYVVTWNYNIYNLKSGREEQWLRWLVVIVSFNKKCINLKKKIPLLASCYSLRMVF